MDDNIVPGSAHAEGAFPERFAHLNNIANPAANHAIIIQNQSDWPKQAVQPPVLATQSSENPNLKVALQLAGYGFYVF